MPLDYPVRSYIANATAGTLSTPITSTTQTFTSSTSLAGWSDVTGGSMSGDIVVAVEYGTANQENILCQYSASTFHILERNYNGETAFNVSGGTHPASATFVVIYSATEAAEANAAVQALKPNVLKNSGTVQLAQDVTVGQVSSAGSSMYAASADHVHTLSATALNQYFSSAGVSLSVQSGNVIYNQHILAGNYTVTPSDVNALCVCTNGTSTSITVNLPLSTTVQFGQSIPFVRLNGPVTITGTGVVSTGATSASPKLRAIGSMAQAISLGSNGWVVVGDIS